MLRWLRDWWRGWSDADLESVLRKVEQRKVDPGALIPVTAAEVRAHTDYLKTQYPLIWTPKRRPF